MVHGLVRRGLARIGVLFLGGWLLPAAYADILEFKNGLRLRGTILKRTATEILVELDFGTTSFTPDEIVSIETEPPSPHEPAEAFPPESIPRHEASLDAAEPSGGGASASASATVPPSTELPNAMKAVAYLGVLFEDGSIGVGSATIINSKGIMVTNNHVVAGAAKIMALFPRDESLSRSNEPKPYEARVLKTDPCYDLALVGIPVKTPLYLGFAAQDSIRAGQEVRAIGNPQGLAVSVSRGIISSVRTLKDMTLGTVDVGELSIPECAHLSSRELGNATFIQTDAAINPGNSGGPLLNDRNEIVGINTLIFSRSGGSEGLGFAVHVKHVRKFVGAYAKP